MQPGLPSEALLRRPDVAEAEATLYAAHANVDAARAAFFPAIGLTGSGSYASQVLTGLTNPANFAWTIGASVVQTIFDGGLKKAQDDLALAQQQQQLAAYRLAVFNAFSDVETQLGQSSADTDQLAALTEEVRASAEAFRISELQYREGTIDILSLLQNQQTLFTAEDTHGADRTGAAGSRGRHLSRLGRRLDPADGRQGLYLPAGLVAALSGS